MAHALSVIFALLLIQQFGEDKVLIAPIKELLRCKAKLNEIKAAPGSHAPYASKICDYMRASVLCNFIEEMVDVLEKLGNLFFPKSGNNAGFVRNPVLRSF